MNCNTVCCGEYSKRNFLSKEEKIEKLKEYKDWLDAESKGVEEVIKDLKKAA